MCMHCLSELNYIHADKLNCIRSKPTAVLYYKINLKTVKALDISINC